MVIVKTCIIAKLQPRKTRLSSSTGKMYEVACKLIKTTRSRRWKMFVYVQSPKDFIYYGNY